MANVHPWFANVTVQAGPQWTWDFFDQTDVQPANALPNKPSMSIAEVGWPTVGHCLRYFLLPLICGCIHRHPRMRVTRTTGLQTLVNQTFSISSITSCVNRTRRGSSITSSSSSMSNGRTPCTVVSRRTGAYSIRSAHLLLSQAQVLIVPHSKTLKGITIPNCPV